MNLHSLGPRNIAIRSRMLLDRLRGLDFLSVLSPQDVGLNPEYAHQSSLTRDKFLTHVLKDFNISPQDSIIDVGCGKGNAMRTMLKFPFTRVDGIELSEQIAATAVQNFKKLKADRSRVFACDARLFEDYDAYNIVYFYNPFPTVVMDDVIDTLSQSIDKSERELVIIYNNPTRHDAIVSKGVFSHAGVYPPHRGGHNMHVYSNRSSDNSRIAGNKAIQRTK
jgi:precorrin-6B methylase 2